MSESSLTATALPPTQVLLKDLPPEVIQSLRQMGAQGNPYALVNHSRAAWAHGFVLVGALLACFGVGLAASGQVAIGLFLIAAGVWTTIVNLKRVVIDLRSPVVPGLYVSNTHVIQVGGGVCTCFPFARIREFLEVQFHVDIPFVPKGPLTHANGTLTMVHEDNSSIRLEVTPAWSTELRRRREVEHAKMLRGGSPILWPSDLFGKWGVAKSEGATAPARGASPAGSDLVRAFAWKDLGDGNRSYLGSLFRKKGFLSIESPVAPQSFAILGTIGFLLLAPFASFWTQVPFTAMSAWISFALATGLAWLGRGPLARLLPWRVKTGLAADSTHLFLVNDGTVRVLKLDSVRAAGSDAQGPFLDLGSIRIAVPFRCPNGAPDRLGHFLAAREDRQSDAPPVPEGWAALPAADGSTRPDPPSLPVWLAAMASLVAAGLFHANHDELLHLEKWERCKETGARSDCVHSIGPDSPAWYVHRIDSVEWLRAETLSTLEGYDDYPRGFQHPEHQAEVPSRMRAVADSFLRLEAGMESRSSLEAARLRFLRKVAENGKLVFPVHLEADSASWDTTSGYGEDPWRRYPRSTEAKVLALLPPRICKSLGFSGDLRMIVEQTDSNPAIFLRAQWNGSYNETIRIDASLDRPNADPPMETWSVPWSEVPQTTTTVDPFSGL
ncbi:MAG: hypothetical protein IPK50_01455 [Fibrobacterota bacterium]|nr:MAG: hypothetical protein IPK50_01455 [Fibrobacterota bacterium]